MGASRCLRATHAFERATPWPRGIAIPQWRTPNLQRHIEKCETHLVRGAFTPVRRLRTFGGVIGNTGDKRISRRLPDNMEEQRYETSIKQHWTEVKRIREFSTLWIYAQRPDVTLRDALGMVTTELLENAIKYGNGDDIQYALVLDERQVTNPSREPLSGR